MKNTFSILTIFILLALTLSVHAGTKRKVAKKEKATHSRKYQKKSAKKKTTRTDGRSQ